MSKKFAQVAFILALGLPVIVNAAAPKNFLDLSNTIVLILNNATAVLIVAGIAIYFYGVSTNILNFSSEGGEKVRAYFLWGVIILFVMVSIWGILRLLQSSLFGDSSSATTGSQTTVPQGNVFTSTPFTGN